MQSFKEFKDRVKVTLTFMAEGIAALIIGVAAYFTTPLFLLAGIVPLLTSIATGKTRIENFEESLCRNGKHYFIRTEDSYLTLPFMFLVAACFIVGALFVEPGTYGILTAISATIAFMASVWSAVYLNFILGMIDRSRYSLAIDNSAVNAGLQHQPKLAASHAQPNSSGVHAVYGGPNAGSDSAHGGNGASTQNNPSDQGGISPGQKSTS